MDICHLKYLVWNHKFKKYKGRVVLRGDIEKDASGYTKYSVNKDHQLHK